MTDQTSKIGIERGGFILFLALVTLGVILVVLPFARPLLWAALAAIMFQPLYRWMLPRCGDSPNRAAIATLLIITFAVVLPTFLIGSVVIEEAVAVFFAFRDGNIDVSAWFTQVFDALPGGIQSALESFGLGNLDGLINRTQDFARESTGMIAQRAVAIGSSAAGFVLAFGVGLYVTYFLLRDGKKIGAAVVAGLPMQPAIANELAEKFLSIVRATIKGSVVVGLVQGALGAITFWIVGMPSVMLFGLLMAVFSLLPALGPALVWAPVAIYLLATGAIWQGVVVIASGVLVIGMADNVLRPILVGRDTGIPDWIILITTLGGIGLMGLAGIVVGPLLGGLFLAGWTIARQQREAEAAVL
ncbi:AI-2E family transporter [Altererythrobacter luteolus]|uniref:AI-2E family transporter n=1 Tax=Pontixanthobacter luteolus TaxID=295089 RepID=A0A6I4V1D3_9SPHN|nr:AI-2E family transporter [Pontixanthobacter luteolus]MXP47648.1 AI-2E family transporter [Pontixanthobacter luteolus]